MLCRRRRKSTDAWVPGPKSIQAPSSLRPSFFPSSNYPDPLVTSQQLVLGIRSLIKAIVSRISRKIDVQAWGKGGGEDKIGISVSQILGNGTRYSNRVQIKSRGIHEVEG